ncbi:reverse transcriptase domain-containing protein [Tanacetum coccineum]
MHLRASNSEVVEPLPEPNRTLHQRLHRSNTRVPFEQRNKPPAQLKVVYAPILNINYFRYFLDILENYNPMDDETMWAADRVVAPTPGSAITILETANELTIKGSSNSDTDKIMARMDAMTMKMEAYNCDDEEHTPQPKSQAPKPVKETLIPKPYKPKIPYPQRLRKEKMEAQYGKNLDMIRAVKINVPLVDVLAGMPNYGKFLKELVPPKLGDRGSFLIPCNFSKAFSCNALADLGARINLMPYSLYAKLSLETLKPTKMSVRLADRSFQHPIRIAENMLVKVGKFTFPVDFVILKIEDSKLNLGVGTERMTFRIDFVMKHSYSNDDTCFNVDVIDEILEEDFDALLDEGSKILYSIEGTILEEKFFAEIDEFIAMTINENSESKSNTEEPLIEKITFNTDYKIKTSLEEPPTDLELKPLPDNLEYVFLEEPSFLPVIISS